MLLTWKIRYLDRAEKEFKDRYLYLDTDSLDKPTQAAVELLVETRTHSTDRNILRFRNLFVEDSPESIHSRIERARGIIGVGPSEYFEDENGIEITLDEIGRVITGSPTARLIPSGAEQHDIDYMLAEAQPVPMADVSLSTDETRILGYFARDFQELAESAFLKDGPGTITSEVGMKGGVPFPNDRDPTLETAVTDDEIRSFVTIFRRLYMHNEPANLYRAVEVFQKAMGDHPLGKWVAGTARSQERRLNEPPHFVPGGPNRGDCTFDRKRLIDIFLYTQYAHQPDDRRQRQFVECLNELNGKRNLLTWLFLTALWEVSLPILSAGRVVSGWFKAYCDHHSVAADIVTSLRLDSPGIGSQEKEDARRARLFHEKSEDLATEIWKHRGRPEGGPMQFLHEAQQQLRKAIENPGP